MPKVSPDLLPGATSRGSYERLSRPGSQSRPTSGSRWRTGTTACDMDIGQPWPGSIWVNSMNDAARATAAPGFGSAQPAVCVPWATAAPMISWYAGWKSISSTRFPYRSWVRRAEGRGMGELRVELEPSGADQGADPVQFRFVPGRPEGADGLGERQVGAVLVEVHPGRCLVGDLVGEVRRGGPRPRVGPVLGDGHGGWSCPGSRVLVDGRRGGGSESGESVRRRAARVQVLRAPTALRHSAVTLATTGSGSVRAPTGESGPSSASPTAPITAAADN